MKYYKLKNNVALCGGPRGTTIEDHNPRPETDFADAEDLVKRGYIEEVEPDTDLLEAEDKAKKDAEAAALEEADRLKEEQEEAEAKKLAEEKKIADEIASEELAKKEAEEKQSKEAEDKARKEAKHK